MPPHLFPTDAFERTDFQQNLAVSLLQAEFYHAFETMCKSNVFLYEDIL